MSDYQDLINNAEEQLFANIKQAQELNLAAVGVMRALAEVAAPPSADPISGKARAQGTATLNRSLEFTTKLMKLQEDYASRLLAEVGGTLDKN